MTRRARTPLTLVAALLLLVACGITSVETPDPAAIPSASLVAQGGEATGPVVELGSGQAEGIGWRYSIYPSGDEWCTQLETAAVTSGSCGDILPSGDAAFGTVGQLLDDSNAVRALEGTVTEEIFTVWLIDAASQLRFPATLMPLEPAGLEGLGFVAFPPDEMAVTHLQAMARSGEILETFELP